MKQISAGKALLLFALGSIFLQTPVLGRQGNVRGIRENTNGRDDAMDSFGEAHAHRDLRKRKQKRMGIKNSGSYDEPLLSLTMFDSGDPSLTMPHESSGDPGFLPGPGGSPDEPGPDSTDPLTPPDETATPVDPALITVNVSIVYVLNNGTSLGTITEDSQGGVVLAEEISIQVMKSGGGRRRVQEEEVTPTEAEIDALINNTFDFYAQVYEDAFEETLLSIIPVSVVTQDVGPGLFFLNFEALLAFSSAPPPEDVATVSSDIEEDQYIEFYVWPSGPYFRGTESVGIVSEADNLVSTAEPTVLVTVTPTVSPTGSPTDATAPPTLSPTEGVPEMDAPTMTPVRETAEPTVVEVIETAKPTVVEVIVTAEPTEGETTEPEPLLTAAPTAGEPVATAEPTEGEPDPVETAAPTIGEPVETAEPTEGEPEPVETASPTAAEVPETAAPTIADPVPEVPETAPPTVTEPVPETAPPTNPPETPSPTTGSETQAPTPCPGRSVRVIGTILLELDPEEDLTEPSDGQVVEVAQHILQAFGVILREEYGNAIRGFTATIDETNTSLDGNAYPLGFDADILFSPCAPPTEEVNAIFADADYPAILEDFTPSADDNVFQHLTGEATYTGEAVIAF